MPRGNGTGPQGMGPMTGRGLGYCSVDDRPGYLNGCRRIGIRGFGRRQRRFPKEFGYGRRFAASYEPSSKEEVKKYLTEEMTILKDEIKNIEKKLSEFDKEDKKE